MKILNIKEKDLSIIIPLKNGHTLLYNTFVHLLNHLKIDFEFVHRSSPTLNNTYIFVRNPIDRFFSSYYWMEKMIETDESFKIEMEKILKLNKINNIGSYIENYENFINNTNDFHFLPQSTEIFFFEDSLVKQEIVDSVHDLKNLYETKFSKKYCIFKIEDIDIIVNNSIVSITNQDRNRYETSCDYENEFFEFLNFLPKESNFLFCAFYSYFKSAFDIHHHRKINYFENITYDEYRKVCKIVEKEYNFFNYEKKVFNYKTFLKKLI